MPSFFGDVQELLYLSKEKQYTSPTSCTQSWRWACRCIFGITSFSKYIFKLPTKQHHQLMCMSAIIMNLVINSIKSLLNSFMHSDALFRPMGYVDQGLFHPHLTKPSVTFYTTVHISGRHMYLYKINTSIRHIHQLQDSNSCKNFSTYSYIFFGSVWGGTTMC